MRKVVNRNVVVISSQQIPNWREIQVRNIDLKTFGRIQIESVLPKGWLERALAAEYLEPLIVLPQSAKLLAGFIERYGKLPDSVIEVYGDMYRSISEDRKMLNLEEEAWKAFCLNRDQFEPSEAVPEREICSPGVANGLLTRWDFDRRRMYRFVHSRLLCYMVARYLVRQEQRTMAGWHSELKKGLPKSHWDDVVEMWAGMILETKNGAKVS